jgi:hypothetical protein
LKDNRICNSVIQGIEIRSGVKWEGTTKSNYGSGIVIYHTNYPNIDEDNAFITKEELIKSL